MFGAPAGRVGSANGGGGRDGGEAARAGGDRGQAAPSRDAGGAGQDGGGGRPGDRGDGATCYKWRAEYGGLKLDRVRRPKQLEQGYSRPRKAAADLPLEKLVLKEAVSGNFRAPRAFGRP